MGIEPTSTPPYEGGQDTSPRCRGKLRVAGLNRAILGYEPKQESCAFHSQSQLWEADLNRRPRGYEPRELPGCSIPLPNLTDSPAETQQLKSTKSLFFSLFFSQVLFSSVLSEVDNY